VVALRALDRVAKGLRTAPRDAMIAESVPADRRSFAFSFHRGLDHLGAAVGPLVAAAVLLAAPGEVRLVFALATVPALAGWLCVQLGTRETAALATAPAPAPEQKPVAPPVRSTTLALLAVFLASLGSASDAFIVLRAAELGLGSGQIALLWSAFHVVKWLASAPAGRFADRHGAARMVGAGWSLHALVYCGLALASSLPALVGLLAIYALRYGMTEGSERALASRLAVAGRAGSAFGALHVTAGAGSLLASLLFGLVWTAVSPTAAFLGAAALSAVAVATLLAAGPRRSA
jgi:MFS family permease